MPKVSRTPPKTPSSDLNQSMIPKSNIATNISSEENVDNITTRKKRSWATTSQEFENSYFKHELDSLRNELKGMLSQWRTEQNETLSKLVTDIAELKEQFSQMRKTNEDLEKAVDFISHKYENVREKVEVLEKGIKGNKEILYTLENQVKDIILTSRPSTIQLRNVPSQEKESTKDLVTIFTKVAEVCNAGISLNDLRDIYRLPGKPGTPRTIVAELGTVLTKNTVLNAVRGFNRQRPVTEKLNTRTLDIPGEVRPVYVDEHLLPAARRLYNQCRSFARENNYQFCWISNGNILLRRDNSASSKITHIKSEQCLAKLCLQK